jgi:hypothetical protein
VAHEEGSGGYHVGLHVRKTMYVGIEPVRKAKRTRSDGSFALQFHDGELVDFLIHINKKKRTDLFC